MLKIGIVSHHNRLSETLKLADQNWLSESEKSAPSRRFPLHALSTDTRFELTSSFLLVTFGCSDAPDITSVIRFIFV